MSRSRDSDSPGRVLSIPSASEIEVTDSDLVLRLSGPGGSHLRIIEAELGVALGLRGNTVRVTGAGDAVQRVHRVIAQLLDVLEERHLGEADIARACRMLVADSNLRLRDLFDDVVLVTGTRKIVSPKGVAQQHYIQAIRDHDVVFGVGPAGTGKTYLAMAMAVRALQHKQVKRIILARPAVEAGEKLGFLPGDLAEKVNPYLRPLYDALHDMIDVERVQGLIERGTIEVAPLAFMRGRTLSESFVILDEAQNTTPEQMKMFLTRIGFDSKAVITGDVTQIDLPDGRPSGLNHALRLLSNVEGIGVRYFSSVDVVRHPLVQRIIDAYEQESPPRK